MKIKELLQQGRKKLERAGIENAGFETEVMLAHLLSKDRVFLYTHDDETMDNDLVAGFLKMCQRRGTFEPLAYILGHKEFMGLEFKVDAHVLIPRPDTEGMVEFLIDHLKKYFPDGAEVLDLCTGSGAIGIALKYYHPPINLMVSDISRDALKITQENAQKLIQNDLVLSHSDLFKGIGNNQTFDLIVSNPPYLLKESFKQLAPDIVNFEPHLALDGGESGLDFYHRIIKEAGLFLKPGGLLALEIGDEQEASIESVFDESGFKNIQKIKDLAGLTRAILGFF